jgi:hypothetical protein
MKFIFSPEKQGDSFNLEIKGREVFCDDKKVAGFLKWNSDYFREGKFDYAFALSREVPANSQIRQVLLAVAFAQHRIII